MGKVRQEKSVDRDYCAAAFEYAQEVVSGKNAACRWIKLSCQRQLDDLAKAARGEFRWHFDHDRANEVCAFIQLLPHVEGRGWKTPKLYLEPWQCFALTSIFGWIDDAGLRRFRRAILVVPRKTGKTTMCAGVALWLFAFDGEPGAQVISAATTRDQAKLSWSVAHRQVSRTPPLLNRFGIQPLAHSITAPDGSFFKPLSRDADSLEGLNIHGAVIDELHAHPNREVYDVINEATGARQQPLIFVISTEGDNAEGVFAEQVKYLQDILEGSHSDDTFFGLYYTIDPADDWRSPEAWEKANPNWNVSVLPADMEARCAQAIQNPGSQASFLTKRLNVRVGASDAYFNMLAWQSICKIDDLTPNDLAGQPCIIAIDMASKSDLTSKVLLFRAKETKGKIRAGHLYAFTRNYLPEEATQPGKPNYDVYRGWIRLDAVEVTDGNITDYEYLERDLIADVKLYRPSVVGIDPNYNAAQFTTRMMAAGVPMVDVRHSINEFTNPMKELAADVIAGRIHHNGDPVLSWAVGNVICKPNAKDDHYPDKSRRDNKIDPAVALIAAKSLMLRQPDISGLSFKVFAV
jgi:phage terminase large subunit-like protein